MHDYAAGGFGADIGVLSHYHFQGFLQRIGFAVVVQNIASKLKWNTDSNHEDKIPMNYRLGSVVQLNILPIKFTVDVCKKEKQDPHFHLGAEYWWKQLALRTGLNHDKFTAGFGVIFTLNKYGFIIDYAYSNDNIAANGLHFFNLNFRF